MNRTLGGLAAFASGLVFAVGLGLAGMTQPSKVIGFLDVGGRWDPSLALVMVSAIAITTAAVWVGRRRSAPLLGGAFAWPVLTRVEPRLLLGAAIFGVGWGLGGYCPGPGIVSAGSGAADALLFTAAMGLGLVLARALAPQGAPTPSSADEG